MMINSIDPIAAAQLAQAARSSDTAIATKANQEFMALFYKELLKQIFKTPDFSLDGGESRQSPVSSLGSEMMIEQLAAEMAKRNSLDLPGIAINGEQR